MEQILLLNPENASEEEVSTYPVREAARAIVRDADGLVALLHVSKKNYYKLPGGGLEVGEDKILALQRECDEEIGCDVEVIGEVGMIVEYRKMFQIKQICYCYIANVKGEKRVPQMTPGEIEDGFKAVWIPLNEALDALKQSKATDLEGREYIIPREIVFIEAAKILI